MFRIVFLSLTLGLGGCGVDVASTAAVNATARAQEGKQAKQDLERIQNKLDDAARAEQARAAEIQRSSGY